jgi:urea transport system substrate-binding protein
MEIDSPANKEWVARYRKKFGDSAPYQNNVSIGGYEGTMAWAQAVKNAGTADREAVIKAWEAGAPYAGPAGTIKMNADVHHASRDIYFGRCENKAWKVFQTYAQQFPSDTGTQCDLVKNPRTNKQFTPT